MNCSDPPLIPAGSVSRKEQLGGRLTSDYGHLVACCRRNCDARTVLRKATVCELAAVLRTGEEMRLLVVEDNKTLTRSLRQGFREEGFAVDVAVDGEEGLWYAESNPYDVIVLDLTLPKLDGLELLRQIRKRGIASHVICLTARGATEDKVHALNLGADDYLAKPFAFEELLARVRSLCRRAYQRKDPVIRVADLEINTASRSVRRGGRVVQLSAREYSLLEFLAFHAGEVVTRTMVWDHLYDFADESASNVVDVYVCLLRKKIDGGGRRPLIHTRRGEGYMLADAAAHQRVNLERKK